MLLGFRIYACFWQGGGGKGGQQVVGIGGFGLDPLTVLGFHCSCS